MDNICKICNQPFIERSHFWKSHKIKESDYYVKYELKFDKLNNNSIPFKSPEQYRLQDFENKNNLKKYLESNSKEIGLEYLKNWLNRRKELKNLIHSPSEWETRTLFFPSIKFFHKFFGQNSYENICQEIGLINRYDYNQILEFENKELNFIVDTRENSVLDVPNKIIKKLDVGDYSIEGSNLIIEKKSLVDLCGTLSQNFDRFERELDRCKTNNQYLIILVEEKFSNMASIAYLPHTKRIKSTSEYIFHQVRQILNLYPQNCQIVCLDGKKEAVKFVKRVFQLKNTPQTVDFQYVIDTNKDFLNF